MRVLKIPGSTPPAPRPRSTCKRRGYCGPFVNQSYYASIPGCEGRGDCAICGHTRDVARQRALRRGKPD